MPRAASRLVPLLSLLLASASPAAECGETLSGTISSPGELDTYTLQLAAGDVVGVTVSPRIGFEFAANVLILTQASQPLRFGSALNCAAGSVCTTVPAPASGPYRVIVSGNSSGPSATYAVTVEVLSGSWNGASNAPPAPACGAVADGMRVVGCGEPISGTIDALGDSDTYSFLASAGDRVGLHGNATLELFAPGGAPVGFDGGSLTCTTPCASAALPATGVYTVRATRFVLGPYSFTLESLRESFAGGSRALLCGTPALACNETRMDAIDLVGDSDTFSFFAEAGDAPSVLPISTEVFANVERFAPDGSRLPATNGALPATGIYTLRISNGGNPVGTGSYELSLVGAQLGGAACPRFPELSCGASLVSDPIPGGGRYRFYSFSARPGDARSLVIRKYPQLDLGVVNVVAPGSSAPLASSTHTVYFDGGSDSYLLSLESVGGSWNGGSNAAPTPICGAFPDGTSGIDCGQTRAGAIDVAGDRDTYTFFAEAGDSVSVQVSPNGVVPSTFWVAPQLWGPNGSFLGGCGFGCILHSLPATGVYTVVVTAQAPLATGAYTITLTRTPCVSDCTDGFDNDGDTLVDGADAGCTSAGDPSELPECTDGIDNDGDGLFDFSGADLGCVAPLGASEDPACDDGFDNDRDGATDADGGGTGVADPTCQGVLSNGVEVIAVGGGGGCGLGPELAPLLLLLAALRRRAF